MPSSVSGKEDVKEIASETSSEVYDRSDVPLRLKIIAFLLVVTFSTSSGFCEATLGPLKSTLRKELKITNAQYGTISSASSLVNTILPLIGGLCMDYWGATYAALISSAVIAIGAIVSAAGTNVDKFALIVTGRVIMGFGSTVIESTQNKLYMHWFTGSHLALIIGADIAWNRVVTLVARLTAVPMSNINGFYGWALWIPAFTTVLNLGLCVAYWAFERSVPKRYQPKLGRDAVIVEGRSRRAVTLDMLKKIPQFFWVLCATQIFQAAVVGGYSSNLADIQSTTRGTTALSAGYNSSLQSVIPIVLTPAIGFAFDRYGKRMWLVSFCASVWIVVFALLGYTLVHPLAPIILGSFALSMNAVPFIASIPLIIADNTLIGTAYGIWKSFNNAGSVVIDVSIGAIQDRTPGGSYKYVIAVLIAFKSVQVFLGAFYDWLDGRWLAHSLRKSEKERVRILEELGEDRQRFKGWRAKSSVALAVGALLSALIVVAWVVSLPSSSPSQTEES